MAKGYGDMPAAFGSAVPDTFVDEVTGFDLINGTLRLDLAVVTRSEPVAPSEAQMAVIGRLIMPIGSAQKLALGLYDYLKKHGLDPVAAVGVTEGEAAN